MLWVDIIYWSRVLVDIVVEHPDKQVVIGDLLVRVNGKDITDEPTEVVLLDF